MKTFIAFLLSFFVVSTPGHAFELQNGDILLISLNCYECRVIESETNSKFSHSGVVIKDEKGQVRIGQSLGSVALYPLEQFLKNRTPGLSVDVYRPKQFLKLSQKERQFLDSQMLHVFNSAFKGLPFDHDYLWDNFNLMGQELLYCSEFIAKYLDHFLSQPTLPYPLSYKKHEEYWRKYFKGVIPEGVLGNSPASFSRDDRFTFVGTL